MKVLGWLAYIHIALVLCLAAFLASRTQELAVIRFLAGLGITGWVAAAMFYFSRNAGTLFAAAAAVAIIACVLQDGGAAAWSKVRAANQWIALATSYALFVLVIGYFPEYAANDWLSQAGRRWLELPIDNALPLVLAKQIWQGRIASPMVGDWLSSDRPPLQAGIFLLFFGQSLGNMQYQVLSSVLQALVLLPSAMLVRRCAPRLGGGALVVLGTTSLLAVHVLFVWPKLLAATFCLLIVPVVAAPEDLRVRPFERALLVGFCAALAMLSHGGAIFALLGLAAAFAVLPRRGEAKAIVVAAASAATVYLPWMAYQRLADPPGDRLLKWHLAGIIPPTPMSTAEALRTAYGSLSWEEWVAGRFENLRHLFAGSISFWHDLLNAARGQFHLTVMEPIVTRSFFDLSYSMWAISPAVALVAAAVSGGFRWRQRLPIAQWLAISSAASCMAAALLLFAPGSAIVHQISLSTWVGLFCTSLALLSQARRVDLLLAAAVVVNVVVFFAGYVWGGPPRSPGTLGSEYTILSTVTFALFASCCFAPVQDRSRRNAIADHSPGPEPASTN